MIAPALALRLLRQSTQPRTIIAAATSSPMMICILHFLSFMCVYELIAITFIPGKCCLKFRQRFSTQGLFPRSQINLMSPRANTDDRLFCSLSMTPYPKTELPAPSNYRLVPNYYNYITKDAICKQTNKRVNAIDMRSPLLDTLSK